MKRVTIDINALIDTEIRAHLKDPSMTITVIKALNFGEYGILTCAPEDGNGYKGWFWSDLTRPYKRNSFFRSEDDPYSTWYTPELAIKSALLAKKEIMQFENIIELSTWIIEDQRKTF